MNITQTSSLRTSKFAEKFAQNWREKNSNREDNDQTGDLDDSLTSLQWLHNITILDITPAGLAVDSSPPGSPRSSATDEDVDTSSEKSDPCAEKETKIDYASDPHRKPPYSYATLICMAMRETNKSKITLSAIYKWIRENFVYYRHADPTWQNSIRHNLSLNKCFVKVARRKDEPGKGGFWKIDPAYADMFVDGVFKRRRNSSKMPRKTTTSNKSMRSKSTSSLPQKRATPWNNVGNEMNVAKRLKNEHPSWNYIRHSNSSDVSDTSYIIEEEIPPYSGGLKQDLSWNSLLTDSETDFSLRDAIDAQGIIIDHNFRVLNSPFTTYPAPDSPSYYDTGDVFVPDDNLDLTIRGVGLVPTPMPSSPPRIYSDHPWAETPPDDVTASLDLLVGHDMGNSF